MGFVMGNYAYIHLSVSRHWTVLPELHNVQGTCSETLDFIFLSEIRKVASNKSYLEMVMISVQPDAILYHQRHL